MKKLTIITALVIGLSSVANADGLSWTTSQSTGYTYQTDTFGNQVYNGYMYSSNGTQTDMFGSPTMNNSLTTGSYLGSNSSIGSNSSMSSIFNFNSNR